MIHNLTVSVQDHLVVYEQLHQLTMQSDDSDYLRTWSELDVLVKWAINGNGDPASYFADDRVSTVVYTEGDCTFNGGCDSPFDDSNKEPYYDPWDERYAEDIWKDLERERDYCDMYFECDVTMYENEEKTEHCLSIKYEDGTVVDGLYCVQKNQEP
ncbi:MAG: hypothetical protein MJK04_17125 [Psychrosphaera sp.]|nr:hypothetical protein [Psychrosphaera sp.]